jgi:hypothetical protein
MCSKCSNPYIIKLFKVAEDGSDKFLRNAGNHAQNYTEPQARRLKPTFWPLLKPRISNKKTSCYFHRRSETKLLSSALESRLIQPFWFKMADYTFQQTISALRIPKIYFEF